MQAIPKVMWIEVSFLEDLPIDTGKTVRYGGYEIALFRLSSGKVLAIENRCPHKNGVLAEGIVCDEHVFCPMHDRKIDLKTGLVQKPDTGCVSTYEVSVANDMVYVAIPG